MRPLTNWLSRSVLLVPLVAPSKPPQVSESVRCAYTRRALCSPTMCKASIPFGDDYLLFPPLTVVDGAAANHTRPVVGRCDNKGCTNVEVATFSDGSYLDLSAPGYMAKVVRTPSPFSTEAVGDFVEVATIFLGTEISYGHCPFAQPH